MEELDNIVFNSLKNAERNIILNSSEKIYLKKFTVNNKINSLDDAIKFLFNFFKKLNTKYFDTEKDSDYLKELSVSLWEDIKLTKKDKIIEAIGRNYQSVNTDPIDINKIIEDMYMQDQENNDFEISNNRVINNDEEIHLDEKDSGNWYYLKIFNNKIK